MQNYVERESNQEQASGRDCVLERICAGIRELGEDDRALVLVMVERLLHKD